MLGDTQISGKSSPNVIRGQLNLPTTGINGGVLIGSVSITLLDANTLQLKNADGSAYKSMRLLGARITEAGKIEFRDADIFIQSDADTGMNIEADGRINMTTPIVNVQEFIKHLGDADTYIRYTTNAMYLYAGNTNGILLDATGVGFFATTPQAQQAHIVDADGGLADVTAKFNTLLADLEGFGLLANA